LEIPINGTHSRNQMLINEKLTLLSTNYRLMLKIETFDTIFTLLNGCEDSIQLQLNHYILML